MKAGTRARLVVLISGRGSNLQAFIDACDAGSLTADICAVISNNPEAQGLQRAADAGIPTCCINHRDFVSREAFDARLYAEVARWQPDLVILAGFMRILTAAFIEPLRGRLLNVHPSLLPLYPGLNTHQRALDAGDSEAGVTVHFVTMELDGGPPVIQARVPIEPGDSAESLAARVILQEHRIYPLAAQWLISGRLRLVGGRAYLNDKLIPETGIDYADATD